MSARKVAITIRKGGSGKTTTAVNLAAALMLKKQRVLVVDLDSQGNATKALRVSDATSSLPTARDLLSGRITDHSKVIRIAMWPDNAGPELKIDVIPSHPALSTHELSMAVNRTLGQMGMGESDQADPMQSVVAMLSPIEDNYDFIILDTAPNEGPLTLAALAAADGAIIPYETGAFNDDGLEHALRQIQKVRESFNPRLVVYGILPTKTENTVFSQSELDGPLKAYKEHVFPFNVPKRTWYNWANRDGVPLVITQASDPSTLPYFQLAEVLING